LLRARPPRIGSSDPVVMERVDIDPFAASRCEEPAKIGNRSPVAHLRSVEEPSHDDGALRACAADRRSQDGDAASVFLRLARRPPRAVLLVPKLPDENRRTDICGSPAVRVEPHDLLRPLRVFLGHTSEIERCDRGEATLHEAAELPSVKLFLASSEEAGPRANPESRCGAVQLQFVEEREVWDDA